jgi:hypothetical protein
VAHSLVATTCSNHLVLCSFGFSLTLRIYILSFLILSIVDRAYISSLCAFYEHYHKGLNILLKLLLSVHQVSSCSLLPIGANRFVILISTLKNKRSERVRLLRYFISYNFDYTDLFLFMYFSIGLLIRLAFM